jgi:acetylornithine deacetylase
MHVPKVLDTLADLVAINSINPAYPGGVPESELALYIERYFAALSIEASRQHVAPQRFNVLARLPGRQPDRRVILEAHMDTVSVDGMSIPPFDPSLSNGRLHGRGSCDTKAGLAAMMHALASLKSENIAPPCEICLAATVDEEHSFLGVLKLCEDLQAHAAIVAEPTDLRIVTASKGVLRFRLRTRGKAAHSAKPHLGVNAISRMAALIQALDHHALSLAESSHPLLGSPTQNIGLIRGGEQINFVPDLCEISLDRRLLPSEDPHLVWSGYSNLASQFGAEIDPPLIADPAMETSASSSTVHIAQRALLTLGRPVAPAGVPFGSDASKLARLGIPSIIFGPGSIDQAHAAIEYVETAQVLEAAAFFRQFILEFA